ncbi:XdhC family protein [Lachnospiraceae bacterium 62-35]
MERIFQKLAVDLEKGFGAVLVTVTESCGSVPRGAGAKMLVRHDGRSEGTIGGGEVEHWAVKEAFKALEEESSFFRCFSLTRKEEHGIGMICGGAVRVYFQYVSPRNQRFRELCSQILYALRQDEESWIALNLTDNSSWDMEIFTAGGGETPLYSELWKKIRERKGKERAFSYESAGGKYYIEPLVRPGKVYVFGGGHVAQALVPILCQVDFSCVVMDDRREFANPDVFPQAEQLIVGDFEDISAYISLKPCDYVCIMTRGHQFDYQVQKQALLRKPRYIGVMGSRNKIKTVTEALLQDGFTKEEIESCHMPIGTRIYAETPAEIAISIAGELIAVRAGGALAEND